MTSNARWCCVASDLRVAQPLSQRVDNPLGGRENAERGEWPSLEHQCTIDEDLELAVRPADDVNVRVQLASDARRHTGGMQARDSIGAGTDLNARHDALSGSLGHPY